MKQTWVSVIADEVAAVKSGRADLRKFGLTMAVALAVLGGLFLWRGKSGPVYFFGIAGAFLLLAGLAPMVLRPVQRVWMTFATVLGWVMTRFVLTLVFFLGITPIAMIARLFRKKFIDLAFEPESDSYWERKPEPPEGKERYERQF
jgi:hypothetical protein